MTFKQLRNLAHSNAIFIEGIPDTFMKTVYAAQIVLYSICIDKLLDKLETENGEISNSAKNRKLIAAFSLIYESFRQDQIEPIVSSLVDNVSEVAQNNIDYYNSLLIFNEQWQESGSDLNTFSSDDSIKPSQELPITDVHQTINFRLGITEAGVLIAGGYLFNIYHDTSVITEIQQSVYKGMITGANISDLKQSMQSEIVGESEIQTSDGEKVEKVTKNGLIGRVLSPVANDVFTQVDRTSSTVISDALKLRYFIYSGTIVKNSRAFCILKCNKVYDTEEAKGWINEDPGPLGVDKDTYDPLLDCGGANCRHSLFYITDELYKVLKSQGSDLIPA